MPYALRTLSPPGSMVAGYQRGYEIQASVIESWKLVEGEDWSAEHPDRVERPTGPVFLPRPVDDSDRGAWVAYAMSRGKTEEEVRDMELADLMSLYPDEQPADTQPDRPADSARKADWVAYVQGRAGDNEEIKAWAAEDSTTKAELQAWDPTSTDVGDPLAISATEQANG